MLVGRSTAHTQQMRHILASWLQTVGNTRLSPRAPSEGRLCCSSPLPGRQGCAQTHPCVEEDGRRGWGCNLETPLGLRAVLSVQFIAPNPGIRNAGACSWHPGKAQRQLHSSSAANSLLESVLAVQGWNSLPLLG